MTISTALENTINSWLKDLFSQMDHYDVEVYYDTISVEVYPTSNQYSRIKLLVLNILDNQVQIPNIFIPEDFRGNGLGLGLINEIFKVTEQYGYELFVVDMVHSFYNYLISRNAVPVDEDSVLINSNTQLAIQNS